MAAIALTLALLLALVVALLAVPLTVAFQLHRIEETRGVVRFRWLFGLVRFQLRIPRPGRAGPRDAAAWRKKERTPRRRKQKTCAGGLLSLARRAAFRRRIYRFVRDILRATHARDLVLHLRIGLGDPADTGRLWAVIGPLAGMARSLRAATVRVEPEFMDPVFEVESHGRFRLVPIQFIAIAAAFMLSPIMLRAWWQLRWGRS